ncbi:TNF receptor-associated factor 6 [Takifugu rubripes]|uniref:TNF receptor-associated factor n=1 Tax=Takifugu rubripes TaxID=31033 RepID=H2UXL8_TAKRU|nr:TNF receptor-associated factor 6 [Takifugu rubripes]XP_011608206.2 TNF receptor-associated factor 6 [Takifugu rubripes]XP_011608207.2 TNF receptor-associated factor 6 [Takifugu rubripes]XP_029702627.1 TNF receptor-associated factor 6 [Takifugu rubripes]XP_029702628.1 TNF receptor-associated factor 6 [Takifugu rubripes]XP_029702629.1 TNF receptor-associated factor 6 [Takifugu rubripes]XP_029702630.1 TNF receptor-associated factor 6 [Takifugu rubripes]XP_029702631.1 TNF receptor-associated 
MACFDSSKESLEDSFDGAAGGKLSGCALAMSEKERESLLNPSESPSTYMSGASSSFQDATHQQGYDVEFDPPLESKYECPICLMALRNAIQTPCGHRFCKICIEKSIRDAGQRCPVDNEMLSKEQLFPDNFAKREILSLTVRCSNPGCTGKMELRHLEDHLAHCQFATVPCPHCQQSVRKTILEEHMTAECRRRPVSCPDCIETFVYEERERHEQQCPFASVMCPYCDMDLVRDQMESHCDTDCPIAPIACTFSLFGCKERMQRHDLARHMQDFTQMHMHYMADFLRGLNLNGTTPKPLGAIGHSISFEDHGASASSCDKGVSSSNCAPCQPNEETQRLREMDRRLVKQDHQLRELIILKETQAGQLAELGRRVSMLEETVRELESQHCTGIFIWRLKDFSVLLRNQEAGLPVVEHSPAFYTGRPGYKLCLRLHLQSPNAQRCSNFISLFVHTMQGAFDGLLTWPFQGTIRLAILDQGPEGQHHVEVMETKPDLQAFQKPTIIRNPKGFGYVTFLHLQQLNQRAYVKDDILLIRCEVTPRFDNMFHRDGITVQPRGPEASMMRD